MTFQIVDKWELVSAISLLVVVVPGALYVILRASSKLIVMQLSFYLFYIITDFAVLYKYFGLRDMVTQKIVHDGFLSLYFSCVTVTTLGYGDFIPSGNFCRIVSISEAITGYFVFAVFVSKLISAFGETQITLSQYKYFLDKLLERPEKR